ERPSQAIVYLRFVDPILRLVGQRLFCLLLVVFIIQALLFGIELLRFLLLHIGGMAKRGDRIGVFLIIVVGGAEVDVDPAQVGAQHIVHRVHARRLFKPWDRLFKGVRRIFIALQAVVGIASIDRDIRYIGSQAIRFVQRLQGILILLLFELD